MIGTIGPIILGLDPTIVTMQKLPVELWQAILDVSTAADRICLRAVNQTLCKLTTPIVFRHLHFENSSVDTKRFKDVLKSPKISGLVEDIHIVILDQEQLTWGTVGLYHVYLRFHDG